MIKSRDVSIQLKSFVPVDTNVISLFNYLFTVCTADENIDTPCRRVAGYTVFAGGQGKRVH